VEVDIRQLGYFTLATDPTTLLIRRDELAIVISQTGSSLAVVPDGSSAKTSQLGFSLDGA
jgi:hypothetical protein